MELEEYLVSKFARAIRAWPQDRAQDIYALSLYRDDNNAPYRPAVYLIYNTRGHAQTRKPDNPDSPEARWNLALWQQDDWLGIEERPSTHTRVRDEEGTRSLEAWLETVRREHGEDADALILTFAALCLRVARRLHEMGVIREVFGRDLPIIMHDDNWDEDMYHNTEAANPPGVAKEFLEATIV